MQTNFFEIQSPSDFFDLLGKTVIFCLVWKYFSASFFKLLVGLFRKKLIQRYGVNSWVVVTGASDGLGKGFCQEFAKEGFNILLIARSKEKLEKVSQELKIINPSIQTKILMIDFKNSHQAETFQSVSKEIQELDISILVNNVGIDLLGQYEKLPQQKEFEMLVINIYPLVHLTKILLPQFTRRKSKSAIINVGSISGLRPMPYFSLYSATKAFNDFFSQAISIEYWNLDVLSLQPMYISTPLTHYKSLGLDTISPNQCARATLEDLGMARRTYGGHWKHKILASLLEFIPNIIFSRLAYPLGIKQEMERRQGAIKKEH